MIRVNSIKIKNGGDASAYTNGVQDPEDLCRSLQKPVAEALKISPQMIDTVTVMRHSIDARKKPDIYDIYMVDVTLKTDGKAKEKNLEEQVLRKSHNKNAAVVTPVIYTFPTSGTTEMKNRPVVIGAGPCGLFAAYELAMHGYCPVLIERGKPVLERQKDVETFWKTGKLLPNSNVQFGEGGAGAFSDGKLNTMVKDKDGRGRAALQIFVDAGAPKEILYEAKPHIGTDRLIEVVANMREAIRAHGGEVLFETQVIDFLMESEDSADERYKNKITGVRILDAQGERTIETETVVMAIGHSARDTFETLLQRQVTMEPKAFAVGLRVEHRQKDISKAQYGVEDGGTLPPAPYNVVYTTDAGRGVYSFCMCPGGYVVNASSEEGQLCVNGMSYYARDSRNANSAIIVTVKPEDFGHEGPLGGIAFQRELEAKAYRLGNGKIPVEYYADFKNAQKAEGKDAPGRADYNDPCCKGDYVFANVHTLLPENLKEAIDEGMEHFGRMIRGFNKEDTLMEGVEARTSSPVRITRDTEDLVSVSVKGLYPAGEGAGYAGGIMSAAIDGMKIAAKIGEQYSNKLLRS